MNPTFFEISIAIAMLTAAIALTVLFQRYRAAGSRRRMMHMIECAGLDPKLASAGDYDEVMRQVRQRCRRCSAEDLCERWLAGEETGKNEFCPNAKLFESLRQVTGTAG